jgi:hypothetical protein
MMIEVNQLSSSDGKKRFKITNHWVWNKETWVNLIDSFGLAYDSGFLTDPVTNGGYSCKHYKVVAGSYQYLDNCGGGTGKTEYGGASWNVDVKNDSAPDAGWGSMNIIAKSATSGSTQGTFIGRYVHDTSINGQINVNIGPLSLAYSSGSSFDERGVQTVIRY